MSCRVQIIGARAVAPLEHMMAEAKKSYASGRHTVLLVPGQYTLQCERELLQRFSLPGMTEDLEVLSPPRLLRRIKEKAGSMTVPPLSPSGQCMAIRQAIREKRDELSYYRSVSAQPNLPQLLAGLMTDMEKASLSPELLLEHAQEQTGATQMKEQDIALLWAESERIITDCFADTLSYEDDLAKRLPETGIVDDADVYVYGFDMLQPELMTLLCGAAFKAHKIEVLLMMDADSKDGNGRIFAMQRRTAADLRARLDGQGIEAEIRYLPADESRRDGALTHLEKNVFAGRKEVYEGDASAIELHTAANPYEEADYAARTLRKWHEEGIPWQHMAVAMPSSASGDIISSALRYAGIPHYMAQKMPALSHPLCRGLIGALRAVSRGYQTSEIIRHARSGFSVLDEREGMEIEKYARANGISGDKWRKPFMRGDEKELEKAEAIRQKLMEPLEKLHDGLKNAENAEESIRVIMQHLTDVNAYEKLKERENQLLDHGMMGEAARNRQIWQQLMNILDELYTLLGTRRLALRDAADEIEAGLGALALSSLPPTNDLVLVGEAGHLMGPRCDAMIVTGLLDGITNREQQDLISERERAELSEYIHGHVGLTGQEMSLLRRSDYYKTMTQAEKKLLLTHSRATLGGEAQHAATMLGDIERMYPSVLHTIGGNATEDDALPLSPAEALDRLPILLREICEGERKALPPMYTQALRRLYRDPKMKQQLENTLDEMLESRVLPPLSRRDAAAIFREKRTSVSRLETMRSCPYKHYMLYGLRLEENKEFVFDNRDRGTFAHEAMERYTRSAMQTPSWPHIDDAAVDQLIEDAIAPFKKEWENGPLGDDAMGRAEGEGYVRDVQRACRMYTRHARNSFFRTVATEQTFGSGAGETGDLSLPAITITLEDGTRVMLRGKIDRIEVYTGPEESFVRVIDMKTGSNKLTWGGVWFGLQLQLLLYLEAALRLKDGLVPAGVHYQYVKEPQVPAENEEEALAAIEKELQLSGIVLAEPEVIEAVDHEEAELSLGKMLKSDGTLRKDAPALERDVLVKLLAHQKKLAADILTDMLSGNISPQPLKLHGGISPCEYCDFGSACDEYRVLKDAEETEKMTREDLVQYLMDE